MIMIPFPLEKTELIEQVTKVKTVIEKNKGEDRSIVREISWFVGRPSSSFTYFEGFEEKRFKLFFLQGFVRYRSDLF